MLKKIVSWSLVALMLVMFAGCGKKGTENGNSNADASSNASQTESSNISEITGMLDIKIKKGEVKKFVSNRAHDNSKEDISIILVTGQSNFTKGIGYAAEYSALVSGKTDNVPEEPVRPQKGIAYSCNTAAPLTDLTKEYDMYYLCDSSNDVSTLSGVTPSFAIKWNALTGTKVVFVQAAVGGVGMHEWVPNPADYVCNCGNSEKMLYLKAVTAYKTVYAALSKKYNIVYTGYIWNQGEHDESYSIAGNTIKEAQNYYDAYKSMHEGFMRELNLDFGGISVVRSNMNGKTAMGSRSYTIARAAQYELCNSIDNLYMLSTMSETCSRDMMDQGNTIHYSQRVLNKMGAEMATNLHNRLGLSAQAAQYSGIKLYTNNGEVVAGFDATGKLTEGKGKINKNTQKNIIFHLDTLGTADIVSAEVNIGQKNGEKYIDSFGEIDWEALKDAGIEELTVKVTVE